jgi:hypothetical protein
MMEKDLKLAMKIWMEFPKESAHLDSECTEDEVDQEA